MSNLFDKYPKKRPPLPSKIASIYTDHYRLNRNGKTFASRLSKKMESWLHRQVAEEIPIDDQSNSATLELGAGTLNQLDYEKGWKTYDIVEPFRRLYMESINLNYIDNVYCHIDEVPPESQYCRIISVAVLEHICELPYVIAKCGLLLTKNGIFCAAIPNEGSLIWKLCWQMTTGIEFRIRYGQRYSSLMAHEHVNTANEIDMVLRYFYSRVRCNVYGISKTLSIYRKYICMNPDRKKCEEYLSMFARVRE